MIVKKATKKNTVDKEVDSARAAIAITKALIVCTPSKIYYGFVLSVLIRMGVGLLTRKSLSIYVLLQ